MADHHTLAKGYMARSLPAGGETLDRIFVTDLVLDVDIGVFAHEHGVTQRVAFDVEIEIKPSRRTTIDEISNVISYDVIVDGVKALIKDRHINLVETLAEEIAAHCLSDPRAARVFVRVSKLEKEPGAVGVEIVRDAKDVAAANIYRLWSEQRS
jgi:dihydroneopterin aldolase